MIRKKYMKSAMTCGLAMAAMVMLVGCSAKTNQQGNQEPSAVESQEGNQDTTSEAGTTKETQNSETNETEGAQTEDTNSTTQQSEDKSDEFPMTVLPDGLTGMKSETKVYPELRDLIIETYEMPEEYLDSTRYFYNYVDLDQNGTDELFVVVMGDYTSGTGGNSALWVEEANGKLHVKQDFTLVNTPVIISDTITNGVHELIVPYYGGGAEGSYAILKFDGEKFNRVSNAETIESLDGIKGKAIIANDQSAELDAGLELGISLAE